MHDLLGCLQAERDLRQLDAGFVAVGGEVSQGERGGVQSWRSGGVVHAGGGGGALGVGVGVGMVRAVQGHVGAVAEVEVVVISDRGLPEK